MDSAGQTPVPRHVQEDNNKKDLSRHKRKQIVSALLCECNDGAFLSCLRHGTLKDVAEMIHVHPKTITQIWTRAWQILQILRFMRSESPPRKTNRQSKEEMGSSGSLQ